MSVQFWIRTVLDIIFLSFYSIYTYVELIYKFFVPNPLKSLAGETILITGSGNGIGREICLQLANSGARLVCWDLNKRNNDQLVKELRKLGALAYAYEVDISDRSQVETVADMVKRDVGDVSIIINNAGIGPCNEFLKYSPEALESTFKVNVLAQFWILREFLPKMLEYSKGHIVTTCSIAGLKANRYMVPYHGSKFAVNGYLESLKDELRHHPNRPDIKFTTVYPTAVNTNLIDGIRFGFRFPSLTPILNPEDVAERLIDGLRRDKEKVYCPPHMPIFIALEQFLPTKLQSALTDFLMYDFKPDASSRHVSK